MNSFKVSVNFFSVTVFLALASDASGYIYDIDHSYVKPGVGWYGWSAVTPLPSISTHPSPPFVIHPIRKAVVSFFQNRYCQGYDYTIDIGQGECQTLPRALCDWNLSLQTQGACIQVFQNEHCQETVSYKRGLVSSKIFRANQCTSTKLNGFDVIRSFRKCACGIQNY